jgi:hypothetical protein
MTIQTRIDQALEDTRERAAHAACAALDSFIAATDERWTDDERAAWLRYIESTLNLPPEHGEYIAERDDPVIEAAWPRVAAEGEAWTSAHRRYLALFDSEAESQAFWERTIA